MDPLHNGPKSVREAVHTVIDYYDGPRKGIANYQGFPHFYECVFDATQDDYSDLYQLTPIDEQVFQLALEDWGIWKRWEAAYHSGQTDLETHPALPKDRSRHEELKSILDIALQSSPKAIIRAGKFSALADSELPPGMLRSLQVEWTIPGAPS
jgi:hypothetical protein